MFFHTQSWICSSIIIKTYMRSTIISTLQSILGDKNMLSSCFNFLGEKPLPVGVFGSKYQILIFPRLNTCNKKVWSFNSRYLMYEWDLLYFAPTVCLFVCMWFMKFGIRWKFKGFYSEQGKKIHFSYQDSFLLPNFIILDSFLHME